MIRRINIFLIVQTVYMTRKNYANEINYVTTKQTTMGKHMKHKITDKTGSCNFVYNFHSQIRDSPAPLNIPAIGTLTIHEKSENPNFEHFFSPGHHM